MRLLYLGTCMMLFACQNLPGENEVDRRLQRMVDQDRCSADEQSPYFRNGACNQAPPAGVRTFRAPDDSPLNTGRTPDGQPVSQIPLPVDRAFVEQGRGRYELFCATCHGLLGDGNSEVAENMLLRKPPSLHDPVIRDLPDGQIFRVISDGYGLMPSYARALDATQRWAVVAYVRALALSQSTPLSELSPALRKEAAAWLR